MIKAALFKEIPASFIKETEQNKVVAIFNKLIRVKEKIFVNVVIVGPRRMKEINSRYRGRNKATDVLTFRYSKEAAEIYISSQEAQKIAGGFKKLLVHGLLHVVGYDHEKSRALARKMLKKQNFILNYGN